MSSLFLFDAPQRLPMPDAEVTYFPAFFNEDEANALSDALLQQIVWEQRQVVLFGKPIDQPRLTAFYGDADISYTYSGLTWQPTSWNTPLLRIKHKVEAASGTTFTSVLLNLYRTGNDSMGWHSDDERAQGPAPTIASVSFGALRKFAFRHRKDKQLRYDIQLGHGSLLLMQGDTQANWQHQLPKTMRVQAPRINLTFRRYLFSS